MSWVDILGTVAGGIGGFLLGGPEGAAAGASIGHGLFGNSRKDNREDNNELNESIKAYRDATELSRSEINRKRDEQNVERRRIEEKQIRSLRNNYRPRGLLNSQANNAPTSGISNKLGA